jgi:peptidylprolyl isomerase domain and WD repeat-containing protein 1
MSEQAENGTALGKRPREDDEAEEEEGDGPQMPAADVDDSSDDEIGPMPVSASEAAGALVTGERKKKKRAGGYRTLQ